MGNNIFEQDMNWFSQKHWRFCHQRNENICQNMNRFLGGVLQILLLHIWFWFFHFLFWLTKSTIFFSEISNKVTINHLEFETSFDFFRIKQTIEKYTVVEIEEINLNIKVTFSNLLCIFLNPENTLFKILRLLFIELTKFPNIQSVEN